MWLECAQKCVRTEVTWVPAWGMASTDLKGILKQWVYFNVDWVSGGRLERQRTLGGHEKRKEPLTPGFCLRTTKMADPVTCKG